MREYNTEVVIAGSGLAGGTLANLLSRNGIRCVVVDTAGPGQSDTLAPSVPRALSVTPASARILSAINVWQKLPQENTGYFTGMHVWDGNSPGEVDFDSKDICEPVLGYIIEQSIIEDGLKQAMTFLPEFKLVKSEAIEAFVATENTLVLELQGGDRINAQLLVAADGSNSVLRKLAKVDYQRHDYQQQAVACVVTTALPHEHIARQKFLGSGPLAFLPMADPHTCGIVWSTAPDQAKGLLDLSDSRFCEELQQAIGHKPGEISACGPRAGFKLFRAQARQYISDRFVMVGDAAHCVHPLAGQGANMALLDVAVLTELILGARSKHRSIASRFLLRQYERWRKGENCRMMMALDALKYLFDYDNKFIRNLRGAGLNTVNSAPFIKKRIMRYAMGLEGDLPDMVRQPMSVEMI